MLSAYKLLIVQCKKYDSKSPQNDSLNKAAKTNRDLSN